MREEEKANYWVVHGKPIINRAKASDVETLGKSLVRTSRQPLPPPITQANAPARVEIELTNPAHTITLTRRLPATLPVSALKGIVGIIFRVPPLKLSLRMVLSSGGDIT